MTIDTNLIERIEALNESGISCFRIAKQARVQPATVRRFVDGRSQRMEEETYCRVLRAVEHFEQSAGDRSVTIPSYPPDAPAEVSDSWSGHDMILCMISTALLTASIFLWFGHSTPDITIINRNIMYVPAQSESHWTVIEQQCKEPAAVRSVRELPDTGMSGGGSGGDGGGGYSN